MLGDNPIMLGVAETRAAVVAVEILLSVRPDAPATYVVSAVVDAINSVRVRNGH